MVNIWLLVIYGFPARHGGYPHSWLVYFMANPTKIGVMTGGTHILGNRRMVTNMVTNPLPLVLEKTGTLLNIFRMSCLSGQAQYQPPPENMA